MKKILLSLLLILCIIGCAKDESWKDFYGWWTDVQYQEQLRVDSIIADRRFVFSRITNTKGDDLLAGEYACLADDTFHFIPWTGGVGAIVEIAQGARHCVDYHEPIIIAEWNCYGTDKEGNTNLWIPFPFSSTKQDLYIDTIFYHSIYTSVAFNRLNFNESYYKMDTTGNITLARRRTEDWQYFYLTRLKDK